MVEKPSVSSKREFNCSKGNSMMPIPTSRAAFKLVGKCGHLAVAGIIFVGLIEIVGCGGPAHEYDSIVTGTVTVDGDLAKSGTVVFHPTKGGKPAIGRIHPDGSYSLRTGQGDLNETDGGTVTSGDYLVTVSVTAPPAEGDVMGEGGPTIPGPSMISHRYKAKETTDLRFTVNPGKQVIVLNLDAAEPAPPPEDAKDSSNEIGSPDEEGSEAGEDQSDAGAESDASHGETIPETATDRPAPIDAAPTDGDSANGRAAATDDGSVPSAAADAGANASPRETAQ
jgi:hypothetical protein